MKTKIYVLCQPDGEIRYIGKTVRPLSLRFQAHLSRARNGEKSHLFNWIRLILSAGFLPTITLIGEVEGNGSQEEQAWIAYGKQEGWRLVNSTEGGEGSLGYIPTEETRKKLSKSLKGIPSWNKGKHCSEETKRKLSEINKGKHPSAETLRKMSEASKGRICSEETRRRMSKAFKGRNKGIPLSAETRHKISISNIGKRLGYRASEETRQKLSKSHKGKPNGCLGTHRSEESKLKMSLAKKGKPWTEEHHRIIKEVLEKKRQLKRNEAQI